MKQLDVIAFSMVPHADRGIALLSWTGTQPASERLANSLLALPEEEIPDALLRFTFEYFENTFVAPEWWEALDAKDRDALAARLNDGADIFNVRAANCLLDDGRRIATWKVLATHRVP